APFPPTVCQASSTQASVGFRPASYSAGVSHISSIPLRSTGKNMKDKRVLNMVRVGLIPFKIIVGVSVFRSIFIISL
ncbi:hypothetical protein, partial [Peribacillus frigoritolerans]|uniref:hypothetical protein n=1 Tax=Peribacillus frigoritolerans TaxID=450367 RepID=UPI0020BF6FF0